ncbi:ROK family transcriptional regulator [Microbacterium sp. LWH12-1.2]|uniref:ROK family transcriptional regulator n=1 Tax=Microbacterium sp. LWH12-1.2 TaxID=3135259 RepID=UPI003419F8D7
MTSPALGTDLAAMRRLNDQAVLTTLWDTTEPMTATHLAASTGLSRTTVEAVLSGMLENELIRAEQLRPTRAGRPARGYRLAADRGIVIGIDIGPHGIAGIAGDLRGTVTAPHRRIEQDLSGGEDAVTAILGVVDALLAEAGKSADDLAALTVGIPGIVDANGHPVKTTVVPDWLVIDIDAHLRRAYPQTTIFFDNDTKLAALAEIENGTIGSDETAVVLRIGNRISAASVVDGRVARGAHGAAGEIGALGRVAWPQAQERLSARAEGGIETLFTGGNDDAVAEFAAGIADGLGALVLAIDPHAVVVSSSIPEGSGRIADALRVELSERALFIPELRASTLGAAAPCLGALAVSSASGREQLFAHTS